MDEKFKRVMTLLLAILMMLQVFIEPVFAIKNAAEGTDNVKAESLLSGDNTSPKSLLDETANAPKEEVKSEAKEEPLKSSKTIIEENDKVQKKEEITENKNTNAPVENVTPADQPKENEAQDEEELTGVSVDPELLKLTDGLKPGESRILRSPVTDYKIGERIDLSELEIITLDFNNIPHRYNYRDLSANISPAVDGKEVTEETKSELKKITIDIPDAKALNIELNIEGEETDLTEEQKAALDNLNPGEAIIFKEPKTDYKAGDKIDLSGIEILTKTVDGEGKLYTEEDLQNSEEIKVTPKTGDAVPTDYFNKLLDPEFLKDESPRLVKKINKYIEKNNIEPKEAIIKINIEGFDELKIDLKVEDAGLDLRPMELFRALRMKNNSMMLLNIDRLTYKISEEPNLDNIELLLKDENGNLRLVNGKEIQTDGEIEIDTLDYKFAKDELERKLEKKAKLEEEKSENVFDKIKELSGIENSAVENIVLDSETPSLEEVQTLQEPVQTHITVEKEGYDDYYLPITLVSDDTEITALEDNGNLDISTFGLKIDDNKSIYTVTVDAKRLSDTKELALNFLNADKTENENIKISRVVKTNGVDEEDITLTDPIYRINEDLEEFKDYEEMPLEELPEKLSAFEILKPLELSKTLEAGYKYVFFIEKTEVGAGGEVVKEAGDEAEVSEVAKTAEDANEATNNEGKAVSLTAKETEKTESAETKTSETSILVDVKTRIPQEEIKQDDNNIVEKEILVKAADPSAVLRQKVLGVEQTSYPIRLNYNSHQTLRDQYGKQYVSGPTLPDQNTKLSVWWDIDIDTSVLKDQDFNYLYITLFGSRNQGLQNFSYTVDDSEGNLGQGYIKSGNSTFNGPELMNSIISIPKGNLGNKLYIRVKAPLNDNEYHSKYSLGLRINPDTNFVYKLYTEFLDQYNKLPTIFKFIIGASQAEQFANTPFNLVEDMFVAEFPTLNDPNVNENFYYDNTRTIVAKKNTDIAVDWYALDLLRIGESEDPNLQKAILDPAVTNRDKVYFVPQIDGGYKKTPSAIEAKMSNGSFKPGTIVSYKYATQRARTDTSYKFDATLNSKYADIADIINNVANPKMQGGNISLFTQSIDPSVYNNAYLAYFENPYSIMRINKTFEMVECFNFGLKDPTLSTNINGVELDRHVNPDGAYLISQLTPGSRLPDQLNPGGKYNTKEGQSKSDAMVDLMKRIYFYSNEEKKEYSKTHNGEVMHRFIESGMRQKVIHYFTDQVMPYEDYISIEGTNGLNNETWTKDHTLTGGLDPLTNKPTKYFDGEKDNNVDSLGIRRLSENEKPLGYGPFVRDEQVKYANKVLDRVLASYDTNSDWNDSKANSVRLVFYSHNQRLQELITGSVTEPISMDKINAEGQRLEGAEFSLTNISTGEVVEWNSQTGPLYLKEGTYKVEETTTPDGYDQIQAFRLRVYREEINADDGRYPFYKLFDTERAIHVNDGYKTSVELIDVPKGSDGKELVNLTKDSSGNTAMTVSVKNESTNLGELSFLKKNEHAIVNDAEFTLTRINALNDQTPLKTDDGRFVYQRTYKSKDGVFTFKQLQVGYYLLEETKVPYGYKKADNELIQVIDPGNGEKFEAHFLRETELTKENVAGKDLTVIVNKPRMTEFEFRKTGPDDTGKIVGLGGAKFRLYSTKIVGDDPYDETKSSKVEIGQDGKVDETKSGLIKFENLPVGEYVLEELVAPRGFQLPKDLEDENERFFGWRLVVYEEKDAEGYVSLKYKLYKLKTEAQVNGPTDILEEVKPSEIIKVNENTEKQLVNIINTQRTVDVEFQKYILNPSYDENNPASDPSKKYIPIDTGKLINKDGSKVTFDLYKSDFYGAKVDADPNDNNDTTPFASDITSDENGVFHIKGLKFNGYYILEERIPPDGYQKANPIVLRVVAETLANEGTMKVIVRDPGVNSYMKDGNTFAGVINFSKTENPGKFTIKKTGASMWPADNGAEVGLRRAYFRLYFADDNFEKIKNAEGYEEYIQKVTPGKPLTDLDGNPIDPSTLPDDQGIITFDQLKPGKYVLEEYRGPAGYEKDPNPWYIQVRTDGQVIKSRDKNDPNFSIGNSNDAPAKVESVINYNELFTTKLTTSTGELITPMTQMYARYASTADDNTLADIFVDGAPINTKEGTRDVTVKIYPKTTSEEKTEKKSMHMILLVDRSRGYREGQVQGVSQDDNINKFLNDLNNKRQATDTDIDISFIEYWGGGSNYKGTYSLEKLSNDALPYPYYESWYDGRTNTTKVNGWAEYIKNYLAKVDTTYKGGVADGSNFVKDKLENFLTSIDKDTKGKTYDSEVAINFAKFYLENKKPLPPKDSYDIIDNMKTLQDKGYDTLTFHTDLRQFIGSVNQKRVYDYQNAFNNFVNSSGGKSKYYFYYADYAYKDAGAGQAPYVQKGPLNEFIANPKYFSGKTTTLTSKVKDAIFTIGFTTQVSPLNSNFEIKKYSGNAETDTVGGTYSGNTLTTSKFTLENGEHLEIKYKAVLAWDVPANQHRRIHDGMTLSANGSTQNISNALDLYREQANENNSAIKPNGEGTINVNFTYNNYPGGIPETGSPGTLRLQMKVGDVWKTLGLGDNNNNITEIIEENAPFEGKVTFEGLGLVDGNGKSIEYRVVYTRNAPYYSDWGEAEVSYYNVNFDNGTANIDISNGNLLKIFNKNENGFRIPLRITKVNDDDTVLTGSQFKARKLINGEAVNGNKPKYSDDAFDGWTEATGLAGDNYFRELTPGIYEMWESQAPEGYKLLPEKWYFKVSVDPKKEPGDSNYMFIDFQFKHTFKSEDDWNSGISDADKANYIGKTVYGLDYENKDGSTTDPNVYADFVRNIQLVADDGRSHPARPDAPYQTIDDAHVTNHRENGELQFNKVSSEGKAIEGAEFKLTKIKAGEDGSPLNGKIEVQPKLGEGGKPIDSGKVDEKGNPIYIPEYIRYSTSTVVNGVNFTDISAGTYVLEETKQAPGYKKIDGYIVIQFIESADGKISQKILSYSSEDLKKLVSTNKVSEDTETLKAIKNEDNLTKFEFTKYNSKGEPVLTSTFDLVEVDQDGNVVPGGYHQVKEQTGQAKFVFEGLKEGRYRLTETNSTIYEKPAPWYFNVVADEEGNLSIKLEGDEPEVINPDINGEPGATDENSGALNKLKAGIKNLFASNDEETTATDFNNFTPVKIKTNSGENEVNHSVRKDKDGNIIIVNYKKTGFRFKKVGRGQDFHEAPLNNIRFSLKKVKTEAGSNGELINYDESNNTSSEYGYYSEARSYQDGSVTFNDLSSGVYELKEINPPASIDQSAQTRWIIKVIKDETSLKVVYDKEYEAAYYEAYENEYYINTYVPNKYEEKSNFTLSESENKLINEIKGIGFRWKKVDSVLGGTLQGAEFSMYKLSDNAIDVEDHD
ncbi:SpaA isopeptide-forming pilin-related protein [Peptoniphilus sp.]|jgi:hypothetical protein|uniref:SpaA isopeptide-forming pilin-related protein n=1 Tax=Peptoniphilus sp. TaxID=1971214 RepID=UPI003D8A2C22